MDTLVSGYCKASSRKGLMEPLARPRAPRSKFHLEPCPMSVSPNPFGLDFGTLDFGTSDLGLTIILFSGCPVVFGNKWIANKWIRWHGQMDQTKCFAKDLT